MKKLIVYKTDDTKIIKVWCRYVIYPKGESGEEETINLKHIIDSKTFSARMEPYKRSYLKDRYFNITIEELKKEFLVD